MTEFRLELAVARAQAQDKILWAALEVNCIKVLEGRLPRLFLCLVFLCVRVVLDLEMFGATSVRATL